MSSSVAIASHIPRTEKHEVPEILQTNEGMYYVVLYVIIELIVTFEFKCFRNNEIYIILLEIIICYSNSGKNSNFCKDSAISIEIYFLIKFTTAVAQNIHIIMANYIEEFSTLTIIVFHEYAIIVILSCIILMGEFPLLHSHSMYMYVHT